MRQQLTQREGELNREREQITKLNAACAAAEAQNRRRRKSRPSSVNSTSGPSREAKRSQEKALADLRDAFKALSADALKQTAPEFLRLAEQSFGKFQEAAKGDLAQRQEVHQNLGRTAQAAIGDLSKAFAAK